MPSPDRDTTDADSRAAGGVATDASSPDDDALVEDELLVEEISIDGMCGVY